MTEKIKSINPKTRRIIQTVLLVLVAVLSLTVIGSWASNAEEQAGTIQALDEKKETVLELAAAATATSVTITLLPGDAATPIADQLAELTNYFLLILCAIYLEKYLVTITGVVAFRFLIPIACALLIAYLYMKKPSLKRISLRILIFALILFFVIPCSVWVTTMIDRTYEASIQTTIDAATSTNSEIAGEAEDEIAAPPPADEEEEKKGFVESIQGLPDTIKEFASDAANSVTQFTAKTAEELKNVLHRFIEAIAVMIITSCVIPVIVLVIFIFLGKTILNGFMKKE